jgi:hypothetical protein
VAATRLAATNPASSVARPPTRIAVDSPEVRAAAIAETANHQRPSGLGEKPGVPKQSGGGFNPYDNTTAQSGGNPYDNARNFGNKVQQPASAPPQRKPMDLKRLEEWMQIKKRLEEQKKNDDED